MTSVALIADIHGNLPALEAVLKYIEARGINDIYCLGDIMGKGPSGAEALDSVLVRCKGIVVGNWERLMLERVDHSISRYFRAQLGDKRVEALSALPRVLFLEMGGRMVKLFHGRPDIGIVYSHSPREERMAALNAMGDSACDVACFADVHAPFIQMLDARILMNTGSVSNACDGIVAASLALLHHEVGTDTLSAEIARVPYDIERAVRDAENAPGLPFKKEYIEEIRTARFVRRGMMDGQTVRMGAP